MDKLDHYLKEDLQVKYYLRYVYDFMIMHQDRDYLHQVRERVEGFLRQRLLLALHPHKRHITRIDKGVNWMGYRVFRGYYKRVLTRNVVSFRRRIKKLERANYNQDTDILSVRSSIASWFGLSKHANAFNLSRSIFTEKDKRNLGKYFLCNKLSSPGEAMSYSFGSCLLTP